MSRAKIKTASPGAAPEKRVASNADGIGSRKNALDKERAEQEAYDRLKAELQRAFAAPYSSYRRLTVSEVIARNKT